MKIAFIGNYPPRICGIATFTYNLVRSIVANIKNKDISSTSYIVAMNDHDQTYNYPKEVKFVVRQNHQRDYIKVAKFINYSDANICILEHEFGIFGGDSGIYVLPMIHRLEIPLIVTLHTVLKNPSFNEKAVICEIGKEADKVVVMSQRAIGFLTDIYDVPKDKIILIEHGIPEFNFIQRKYYKKKLHLEKYKTLFTFGLLSRNKGIETVIQALPKVIEKHPDIMYIVLGKTHPNVIKSSGEEYRNYLERLVKKNNLEKYVYFYDHYVSEEELSKYLVAIDIYITPYLNEAQITSGTLSYAVGAGAAVISTPYWHAQELLADGRGRLFNFRDSEALSNILNDLLDKPKELNKLRKKAYDYGQKIVWKKIGAKYLDLSKNLIKSYKGNKEKKEFIIDPSILPVFSLEHIKRLTDDTGILQHANFNVPNLKKGYCLDDNSRALLMILMAYNSKKDPNALNLLPVYLSFINYMQNDDGTFRNVLSYNRNFIDEVGTEDSFGRTIWALGYLIRFAPKEIYFQVGKELFAKAYPNFDNLKSLRGISETIIGICHYLHHFIEDENMNNLLKTLTYKIIKKYENEKTDQWNWFEPRLTYDNGIIPMALLCSYKILHDEKILTIAKESIEFLESVILKNGYISLIGNSDWYERGGKRSYYAQQPIDAMAMVLLYYQAYIVTNDKSYINKMYTSFMWFLGENDLRIPLYDFETCGCCDGLEKYGVNRNQGAESTLAYLIAHLTVLNAYEKEI